MAVLIIIVIIIIRASKTSRSYQNAKIGLVEIRIALS